MFSLNDSALDIIVGVADIARYFTALMMKKLADVRVLLDGEKESEVNCGRN